MHKYITLRGCPNIIRRITEDLQDVYLNFKNKKTGKQIGLMQLMPREIKTFEIVFPETEKKNIKKIIRDVVNKNQSAHGGCAVHFGPFKKDKFIDGVEQL